MSSIDPPPKRHVDEFINELENKKMTISLKMELATREAINLSIGRVETEEVMIAEIKKEMAARKLIKEKESQNLTDFHRTQASEASLPCPHCYTYINYEKEHRGYLCPKCNKKSYYKYVKKIPYSFLVDHENPVYSKPNVLNINETIIQKYGIFAEEQKAAREAALELERKNHLEGMNLAERMSYLCSSLPELKHVDRHPKDKILMDRFYAIMHSGKSVNSYAYEELMRDPDYIDMRARHAKSSAIRDAELIEENKRRAIEDQHKTEYLTKPKNIFNNIFNINCVCNHSNKIFYPKIFNRIYLYSRELHSAMESTINGQIELENLSAILSVKSRRNYFVDENYYKVFWTVSIISLLFLLYRWDTLWAIIPALIFGGIVSGLGLQVVGIIVFQYPDECNKYGSDYKKNARERFDKLQKECNFPKLEINNSEHVQSTRYIPNLFSNDSFEIGFNFERFVGNVLEKLNYIIIYAGDNPESDKGIDLFAIDKNYIYCIQCKYNAMTKPVPNDILYKLLRDIKKFELDTQFQSLIPVIIAKNDIDLESSLSSAVVDLEEVITLSGTTEARILDVFPEADWSGF